MNSRIRAIQRSYPIIWHRCHSGHAGRKSALSDREAMVLQHLCGNAMTPVARAAHLGIAPSTLSEVANKLVTRGLVQRQVDPADRRRITYVPTASGEAELDASSPLSSAQLERALGHVDDSGTRHSESQIDAVVGPRRGRVVGRRSRRARLVDPPGPHRRGRVDL